MSGAFSLLFRHVAHGLAGNGLLGERHFARFLVSLEGLDYLAISVSVADATTLPPRHS